MLTRFIPYSAHISAQQMALLGFFANHLMSQHFFNPHLSVDLHQTGTFEGRYTNRAGYFHNVLLLKIVFFFPIPRSLLQLQHDNMTTISFSPRNALTNFLDSLSVCAKREKLIWIWNIYKLHFNDFLEDGQIKKNVVLMQWEA